MTDMNNVDIEIAGIDRGIKEVEKFIAWSEEQLERYRQMPESEFQQVYIGQLIVSIGRYGDEIEKLKHERHRLRCYKIHHGEWWKCPNCDTTNSPFRCTCDNCI
jgi:hypothetical protein